jgi:hypothetical protein
MVVPNRDSSRTRVTDDHAFALRRKVVFGLVGLWCNGSTELSHSFNCGFESRQVHSLDSKGLALQCQNRRAD